MSILNHLLAFYITFQVMTVPHVSAAYHYTVDPFGQCVDYQIGMNHARAHGADDSYAWRIWYPRHSGEVGAGIRTPIATKGEDQRFKLIVHHFPHLDRVLLSASDLPHCSFDLSAQLINGKSGNKYTLLGACRHA